jgi:hypothetical protein
MSGIRKRKRYMVGNIGAKRKGGTGEDRCDTSIHLVSICLIFLDFGFWKVDILFFWIYLLVFILAKVFLVLYLTLFFFDGWALPFVFCMYG